MKDVEHKEVIIVTVRGTVREREGLHAAAKREGLSANQFVRERLGMRPAAPVESSVVVDNPQVQTPYGTFTLSRRATYGFSVVRAKHDVWHHGKRLTQGRITIVEHRKRPHAPSLIAMGWAEHIATYDLAGTLQEYQTAKGGRDE